MPMFTERQKSDQALADILDAQIRRTPSAWFFWPEWPQWLADAQKLRESASPAL